MLKTTVEMSCYDCIIRGYLEHTLFYDLAGFMLAATY